MQVTALNFQLSSIFDFFSGLGSGLGSLTSTPTERPVFPRADLVQELGQEAYDCVVASALHYDEFDSDYDDSNSNYCKASSVAGSASDPSSTGSGDSDSDSDNNKEQYGQYGVDMSFPMHRLEQQQQNKVYEEYMKGCTSSSSACKESEKDRIDMNLNQPPVMQNYTLLGFQKTKVPPVLMEQLTTFWNNNKQKQKQEQWKPGDTHLNHWESSTTMIHLENPKLQGGGMHIRNQIVEVARNKLQRWIDGSSNSDSNSISAEDGDASTYPLSPTSLYGIRVYHQNAILAPHVDRLPLVTSAIINVAQNVDEPWPLELIAHDGKAYNITMEPGDMILYESQSVIHGRPYALKGKYYANIFVHFEPHGHCTRHADRMKTMMNGSDSGSEQHNSLSTENDAKALYQKAQQKYANNKSKQQTGNDNNKNSNESNTNTHESKTNTNTNQMAEKESKQPKYQETGVAVTRGGEIQTPYYIQPNSMEEFRWKQQLEYEKYPKELNENTQQVPLITPNTMARRGRLDMIQELLASDPKEDEKTILEMKDKNGWQPLHEAVRGGHYKLVMFLIEKGVDVNARTNRGTGGSPLWWAETKHGEDHPITVLLKKHGAISHQPQQHTKTTVQVKG